MPEAVGHTTSTGLATLVVDGAALTYRLSLVLAELSEGPRRHLMAAADGDAASAEAIAGILREKLVARGDGAPCRPGRIRIQGARLGEARVQLEMDLRCPGGPGRLTLRDDWPDVLGEHHRTLLRVEGFGASRDVAFTPEMREVTLERTGAASPSRAGFFWLGVEHILTGYDHVLFLVALVLGGGRVIALLKIITAFTVAHSLALAAALLGLVTVPDRLVESLIAASIAWVAAENLLLREAPSRRWLVTFGFGLVHGLGFAGALSPLALSGSSLARALVGFNLGVEGGQAAVLAVALPGLIAMRRYDAGRRTSRALSLGLLVVGVGWCLRRLLFA